MVFLPTPFANLLPSQSIVLFGLTMLERDGLAALAATAVLGPSVASFGGVTSAVLAAVRVAVLDRITAGRTAWRSVRPTGSLPRPTSPSQGPALLMQAMMTGNALMRPRPLAGSVTVSASCAGAPAAMR